MDTAEASWGTTVFRPCPHFAVGLVLAVACMPVLLAQGTAEATSHSVEPMLGQPIQPTAVTAYQLQRYLMKRIPRMPAPSSPEEWKAEGQKLRRHILADVAFHGWPREWVESPAHFEQTDVIATGKGYRLHKLRYEIVPGFAATAILYEPEQIGGRAPAILNVIGHEPRGNAEDDCCFRAALVKPYIYDQTQPFFKLFGDQNALAWHENRDPGTHNYDLDNREQAYRFFSEHFRLPIATTEIPSDDEIRSPQELAVGLPRDNLTIAGLARKLAGQITRPATIVLNDKGRKAAGEMVSARVNRGEQVFALEVLFNGATVPQEPDPADWEMLVATIGERPLGLQVAQLLAVSNWMRTTTGRSQIRLETEGMRSQVVALVAAALEPATFSEIVSNEAIKSLGYLIEQPLPYRSAPELFCLDFYKYFDLDRLAAMAAPVKVTATEPAKPTAPAQAQ